MANRRKVQFERDIERKCVDYAKEQGWKAKKLTGMFDMGWPDRLFIQPRRGKCNFPIFFVEFKRPGEELTPKQEQVKYDLTQRGQRVFRCDSFEGFKRLLAVASG